MSEIEELNRDFNRTHVGGEVGPNGHRVGYSEDGDKVEWIPEEETLGEFVPLLLRRNDKQFLESYNEFWDRVWWNRHESLRLRNEEGGAGVVAIPEEAFQAARRIEEKYGRDNLELDPLEFGLLSGRMSALSWVLGSEWDESLGT